MAPSGQPQTLGRSGGGVNDSSGTLRSSDMSQGWERVNRPGCGWQVTSQGPLCREFPEKCRGENSAAKAENSPRGSDRAGSGKREPDPEGTLRTAARHRDELRSTG